MRQRSDGHLVYVGRVYVIFPHYYFSEPTGAITHTHTQHAPYSTHFLQPSRSALPRAPHAHASVQGTKRAPQAKYSPCCAKRAGFAVVGAALGLGFEGALALVTFATV